MKTALVTGGANRIGAQIVKALHKNDYKVIIHYNNSMDAANALCHKLNLERKNSALIMQADISTITAITKLSAQIPQLDVLINNAAVFYPTKLIENQEKSWHEIINTNLMAPFFLSQTLAPKIAKNKGCIINIADIHSQRPLKNHSIYNISKAGISMLTKSLAQELAPDIRVCAVSPGLILWPENKITTNLKQQMLKKIALKKSGNVDDIANTIMFLIKSSYITGQIITVDGGRTLNQ